jgi:hypothetical protein
MPEPEWLGFQRTSIKTPKNNQISLYFQKNVLSKLPLKMITFSRKKGIFKYV